MNLPCLVNASDFRKNGKSYVESLRWGQLLFNNFKSKIDNREKESENFIISYRKVRDTWSKYFLETMFLMKRKFVRL